MPPRDEANLTRRVSEANLTRRVIIALDTPDLARAMRRRFSALLYLRALIASIWTRSGLHPGVR